MKIPVQRVTLAIAGMALLTMSGCGGGGGGSAAVTPKNTIVSGIASKGPLNGSNVCAYAITGNAKGSALGACATNIANGNYSIDIGTYTGPVLFEVSGGTYTDEASGATVALTSTLHSMLSSANGGAASVAITPLTELAYLDASAIPAGLTGTRIQSAVARVQANFGVSDIIGTMPADALNVPVSATSEQKKYALALATVAQLKSAMPAGTSLPTVLRTVQTCLAAPTTACGSGVSNVGVMLNSAMSAFQAQHAALADVSLPLADFGTALPAATSIETVKANLNQLPPSAVAQNRSRSATITYLDSILWAADETQPTPAKIVEYYRTRVAKVNSEIQLPVTVGVRVWSLYNHGFIVKTPTSTFAFDLVQGKGGGFNSPAWNVELPDSLLAEIDILFVSHEHGDHYDETEKIPAYIKAHGGQVVYPRLAIAKPNATRLMSHMDSALIGDIKVNAYNTLHNAPTQLYEVTTGNGYKIVHTGDTQLSTVFPQLDNIHVLLLNGWINENGYESNLTGMKNALRKLKPDVMIPGHFQELNHARTNAAGRYPYTNGVILQDDPSQSSKTVVLTWGERLDYLEPVCSAPLVRIYHECKAPLPAESVITPDFIGLSAEFPANANTPSGITGDGQSLWVSNYAQGAGANVIFRYTKSTGLVQGGPIPTPSQWTSNLCFDGSNIWLTDYLEEAKIFKISPTTGAILASFPAIISSVAHQPAGLAWDGNYLYYAQSINTSSGQVGSTIYKIDPVSGASLGVVYTTTRYVIDGMVFRDNSLWFVSAAYLGSPAVITNKLVNISLAGAELAVKDLPNHNIGGLMSGWDYLLYIDGWTITKYLL